MIFGLLIALLAIMALLAWLMYTKVIPSPFVRDFTEADTVETSQELACPPADAVTVDLAGVSANVFNSTDRSGLASSVSATLQELGVTVGQSGNWPDLILGDGQIQAGPSGIVNAYTLAQLFPGMPVHLDSREDASADVILGYEYAEMSDPEEFAVGEPIPVPSECAPPAEDEDDDSATDPDSEGGQQPLEDAPEESEEESE